MNLYEGLFIFSDLMQEEALNAAVKTVHGEIEKAGGAVEETIPLGRRSFARHLAKKEAGHYVQIIFRMAPERVNDLRARCRLHDKIFRAQVSRMTAKE